MMNRPFPDPLSGVPLREMLDQLFTDAVLPSRRRAAASGQATLTPPVNMYETNAEVVVIVPLPGVSPNDIEVDLLGTQLTIRTTARRDVTHGDVGSSGGSASSTGQLTSDSGQARAQGGSASGQHRYYLHEFHIGPYERQLELPREVDADKVQSSYEHGLLSLRFPCRDAQRPRRINLQSR
jgi:HSP20 family protein